MLRLKDASGEGNSAADPLPVACVLFARLAKMQLFFDGNKHTALFAVNTLLRKHASSRVLLVPAERDSRREFLRMLCAWYVENDDAVVQWLADFNADLYFVKLICTVSSLFLDSFVVHSGRFGLSGFLLVLFGYFISEWVFL